jgi:uncharacterized protein YuzE
MKIDYDPEADILNIEIDEGQYSHSIRISDYVSIDLSPDERVLSFEVAAASKFFKVAKKNITADCKVPWHLLAEVSRSMRPEPVR